MRGCWNRQTGTFEVRVSNGVGVQVPSLAPSKKTRHIVAGLFTWLGRYGLAPLVFALAKTIGFDRSQSYGASLNLSSVKTGVQVPPRRKTAPTAR